MYNRLVKALTIVPEELGVELYFIKIANLRAL